MIFLGPRFCILSVGTENPFDWLQIHWKQISMDNLQKGVTLGPEVGSTHRLPSSCDWTRYWDTSYHGCGGFELTVEYGVPFTFGTRPRVAFAPPSTWEVWARSMPSVGQPPCT